MFYNHNKTIIGNLIAELTHERQFNSCWRIRSAGFGKAHATMEVNVPKGVPLQLQGKQNEEPIPEYFDRMLEFVTLPTLKDRASRPSVATAADRGKAFVTRRPEPSAGYHFSV